MASQPNLDRDKVVKWLNEKWKGSKECPISGGNNWSLPADLVEVRPYLGGGMFIGGRTYPQVMVVCNECGYAMFFNATTLGLLPPAEVKHAAE